MGNNLTLVLLPILAGAVLIACMNPIQRVALQNGRPLAPYLAASYGVAVLGFAGIYVLRWGFTLPQNLKPGFWYPVVAAGFINIGVQYYNTKALTFNQGEVSLVAPLAATTPGLIAVLAVALGEIPGIFGWMGIMLMVAGSWMVMAKEGQMFAPFERLRMITRYHSLTPEERDRAKVVMHALGSALFSTPGLLAVGLYARRGGDMQGIWVAVTVAWCVTGLMFALVNLHKIKETAGAWSGHGRLFALAAVLYAALLVGANWLEVPVFAETYVAYVGTLNRIRILIAIIVVWLLWKSGAKLFEEQDLKKRFTAASIIVAGAALIASEGIPAKLTDKLVLFGF